MTDINFTECTLKKSPDSVSDYGFTNYMYRARCRDGFWHRADILPYGEQNHPPQTTGARFALTVCETLRITKDLNGKAVIFRPDMYINRLCESAKKEGLPAPEREGTLYALKELIKLDKEFLGDGKTLFASIMLTAIDGGINPYPVNEAELTITLECEDTKNKVSQSLIANEDFTVPQAFTNSAMLLAAGAFSVYRAKEQGYSDCLWLDPTFKRYVVQTSGANLFFRIGDTVISPEQYAHNGVTRDSALELMRSWGIDVSTRDLSMDELVSAYNSNTLCEVFSASTRGGINPVVKIDYKDTQILLQEGKLAQKLSDTLKNIELGSFNAVAGWTVRL